MRKTAYLALASLMLLFSLAPVSAENDLNMDVLRFQVIPDPDGQLVAMQNGMVDIYHDLMRLSDLETLAADGFLITEDPGFHIGFIGFNIREDQSYRRGDVTYWPLHDVAFRHALFHCYDQLGIIPPIYGYIATPLQSLVPPAQGRYHNTATLTHPYSPGDPFTSPAGEHSTCGILKEAGYTFVDADSSGAVTDADYWITPIGVPLPTMKIWTPLLEVAPTSYQHGQEFGSDLAAIGLGATTANGMKGIFCEGEDFNWYLERVLYHYDFDGFMVFYSLGRIPDQLYRLLRSPRHPWPWPQPPPYPPWDDNAPGVDDPVIDWLCDIVRFSLNLEEVEAAAKQIQEMIFNPDKSVYPNADNFALAYMTLYSRVYFNAYNPNLRGIVGSFGYGSNNKWTDLNIHWEPGTERIENGEKVSISILDDYPSDFNPLSAKTESEWNILGRVSDGLIGLNPYNHDDIPWLAEDWTITETSSGMSIGFTLRDDVYWQDGKPFTAYDVEFCLEFLRDYQVPRYADTWTTLIDVVVTDATHLTIQADEAGIGLFYDYGLVAPLIPEHIWNRFGDPTDPANRQAVLDYDPTEAYNVAPGYTVGPTPPPTNLFGTGPFVFEFDETGSFVFALDEIVNPKLRRNEYYFKTSTDIDYQMTEMFHEVGDADKNGVIDVLDQQIISFAYGYFVGEPNYNPAADIVQAPFVIDIKDLAMHGFNLGKQREYP